MPTVQAYRQRIDALLGENAAWENPETLMDSSKSIGLSEQATALRIETEQLISELQIRRPEWIVNSSRDRFTEAMQYASIARQLLNYHAALAGQSPDRFVRLLGLRDALMGDLLEYIVSHERERGKVLAFAQNSHLMRGKAEWTIGSDENSWWSAGAHISERFGKAYAMIGMVSATSVASSLGQPETGTLEAALTASPGPARLIPTHQGQHLPAALIAALPTRTANPQYFPLTSHSFTDFDWLCVLDDTPHTPRNVLWP
jgi:erythromycin esterase-like protein